ncbi:MAG: hypothetical protein GVY23_04135 [Spirochaetes bacterium]|nr:hypothetical protein [Spirochaetota bacterium]
MFEKSLRAGVHLAISGQVLREYLVVATRPIAANGFGMQPKDAVANAKLFKQRTVFLEEAEAIADRLRELVDRYALGGARIHDATLCVVMSTYGIRLLITQNGPDFAPFSELETRSLAAFDEELAS